MTDNETAAEKRIVERLSFDAKTAKRVGWEAFEFTVEGPHLVRVTNASYGFEKDDHSYLIGVEERDGVSVPAECDCPADLHRDPDCKHKVALATVGGTTVLNAAVDFESPAAGFPVQNDDVTTAADKLQTDGGITTGKAGSVESLEYGPCYTYHYEPAHVGGERYVRCTECGAECVPANPDRLAHYNGCSEDQR